MFFCHGRRNGLIRSGDWCGWETARQAEASSQEMSRRLLTLYFRSLPTNARTIAVTAVLGTDLLFGYCGFRISDNLFTSELKVVRPRPRPDVSGAASPGNLQRIPAAPGQTGETSRPRNEWRTRQDSNLWPLPSEGSALSS
jgi:hypothetical protein